MISNEYQSKLSIKKALFLGVLLMLSAFISYAQGDLIEIGESMEDYIKENHVENIEKIAHQFTSSHDFLEKLLQEGHNIDPKSAQIRRKDVAVGKDIDVYVKHFTEHQNFTMFLIPINFYAHAIYDTLLISVIEVSDSWLKDKYHYANLENDSIKSHLLSLENHSLLAEHMYHQSLENVNLDLAEVKVKLHESYMNSNSINIGTSALSDKEKKEFRKTWGLMKKILTHNVNLNAEMNIYVFGYDDMEIDVLYNNAERIYKVTPGNIFTRHHFQED